MKIKLISLICLIVLALSSCRKEETEFVQAPTDETLTANSSIAYLMQNTSSNDGSNDNIIDKSNCFNIKLPMDVTVNNNSLTVKSEADYKIIEYIFDDDDDDDDTLDITFPITIMFEDYTEATINSLSELSNYSVSCKGENVADDDIECIDFLYPISASVFNKKNEVIDAVSFRSDSDLNTFIKDLNTDYLVTINFPITVILYDESTLSISNLKELETTINNHKADCDEDDDFNYNDDDCDDCNVEQLVNILTDCNGWTVDKLKRYSYDYDDVYDSYTFNFYNNGSVAAYYDGTTLYGSWVASGTGNNLKVVIDIPDLPYCNNDWILHEISKYTETKVDFRVGDNDRMRYANNCD